MSYYSIKKTGIPGQCQRCKNEVEELFEFELTNGDTTKNYRLCRDCAEEYYSLLKNKGWELRQEESPKKERNSNISNNKNTFLNKKKSLSFIALILAVVVIAGIVGHISVSKHQSNSRQTVSSVKKNNKAKSLKIYEETNDLGETTEYVNIGEYPQTQVTDSSLISALNNQGGEWISYEYTYGDGTKSSITTSDYMRYKDVKYNNEKYRGVIFDTYRPEDTASESTNEIEGPYNYQHRSGYDCDEIYWFKYEPIKWRVLDRETGLVVSELIIDSQPYDCGFSDESTLTWETCSIRKWLNEDFYNTSFTQKEESQIIKGENHIVSKFDCERFYNDYITYDDIVTTGLKSYDEYEKLILDTFPENNEYISHFIDSIHKTVTDSVFLLSIDDILTCEPFSSNKHKRGSDSTDYAKSQGLARFDVEQYGFEWWLRDCYDFSIKQYYDHSVAYEYYLTQGIKDVYVSHIESFGDLDMTSYKNRTYFGIRPAMYIKL